MSYDSKLAQCEVTGPVMLLPTRQPLRQRMEERLQAAKEHLADVEQVLKFLDDNPNFETFHNLLGKTGL